ncbi:MAG: TSUP family transporter, partial [Myxococcales bacterium]
GSAHWAPPRLHAGPAAFLVQLAIAFYGGYLGGGMGMMMLAAFTVFGMTDIHQMNGFKSALGVAINGVAVVTFVAAGIVAWTPALLMVLGASLGGYGGGGLGSRREEERVRRVVKTAGG